MFFLPTHAIWTMFRYLTDSLNCEMLSVRPGDNVNIDGKLILGQLPYSRRRLSTALLVRLSTMIAWSSRILCCLFFLATLALWTMFRSLQDSLHCEMLHNVGLEIISILVSGERSTESGRRACPSRWPRHSGATSSTPTPFKCTEAWTWAPPKRPSRSGRASRTT